jgi:hypothetical protein
MAAICSMHETDENGYKISVRKPEGKRLLEDLSEEARTILKLILRSGIGV